MLKQDKSLGAKLVELANEKLKPAGAGRQTFMVYDKDLRVVRYERSAACAIRWAHPSTMEIRKDIDHVFWGTYAPLIKQHAEAARAFWKWSLTESFYRKAIVPIPLDDMCEAVGFPVKTRGVPQVLSGLAAKAARFTFEHLEVTVNAYKLHKNYGLPYHMALVLAVDFRITEDRVLEGLQLVLHSFVSGKLRLKQWLIFNKIEPSKYCLEQKDLATFHGYRGTTDMFMAVPNEEEFSAFCEAMTTLRNSIKWKTESIGFGSLKVSSTQELVDSFRNIMGVSDD